MQTPAMKTTLMDAPDIGAMAMNDPETVANWPASAWHEWLSARPHAWAQLTPQTVALLNSEVLNQLARSLPLHQHPLSFMRRRQMRAWLLSPGNDCRDLQQPTLSLICSGLLSDWLTRKGTSSPTPAMHGALGRNLRQSTLDLH